MPKRAALQCPGTQTAQVGTLNLLEAARRWTPESPFIHVSTNKVYGDRPNTLALVEKETRWDYADPEHRLGIPRAFRSTNHCIPCSEHRTISVAVLRIHARLWKPLL
jgi:hypothetical protein